MAREGITYKQVSTAIDRLQAAGQKPTLRAVRADLGTGSMGTIQAHIARWKEEHHQAKAVAEGLPANMQQVILDGISAQVNEARAELEQQLSDAQEAISDLSKENEILETDLAMQSQISRDLDSSLATENGRAQQLQVEISETEKQAADAVKTAEGKASVERQAAESARIETAELRLKLEHYDELKEEVKTQKGMLEHLNQRIVNAEKTAATEAARASAAEKQLEKVETRGTKLDEEIRALRDALQKAEKQMAGSDKEAAAATARADAASAQIRTLEQIAERAEKRLEKAEANSV